MTVAHSFRFTLSVASDIPCGAVGLAMIEADQPIDTEWIERGAWTVDIAGREYPAIASLRPLYDPQMSRIKS